MKKILLLTFLAVTILTGCKKDEDKNVALTLNRAELELQLPSDPIQLSVADPSRFTTDPNLRWMSEDADVAYVDYETGKVTATGPGKTIIYGYIKGLEAVRGQCEVTVGFTGKLTFANKEFEVNAGEVFPLEYAYDAPLATSWEVEVEQSDTTGVKSVALAKNPNLVDKAGKPVYYDQAAGKGQAFYAALRPGTVKITITNGYNSKMTDQATVTVKPVAMESYDFAADAPTEIALGASLVLETKILPEAAAYRNIYFKSLNTGVLTIDAQGTLKPIRVGSADVLASTDDGTVIRRTINVVAGTSKAFQFTEKTITLAVGGAAVIIPLDTDPAGAGVTCTIDQNYVPKSGTVAKIVMAGGKVSAPWPTSGTGTALLIAQNGDKDKEGKLLTDTCVVNVVDVNPALVLMKAAYVGAEFGAQTSVTAYLNNYSNAAITLTKAELYIAKGTMVGTALEKDEVLETLEVNLPAAAGSGVAQVTFKNQPSDPAKRAGYKVAYTFTTPSGATYTISKAVVQGNGASFVNKK